MTDATNHPADGLLQVAADHPRAFSHADAPAVPRTQVAVVTCMDARIDPARLFGLEPGDAHVIRNAGGIVTDDVVRSLSLSQALLDTRAILVIQHTRCGVNATEDDLRQGVAAAGAEPPPHLGGFEDLEESVRRGLERLAGSPELLAGDDARGFVYDVDTGALREVTR